MSRETIEAGKPSAGAKPEPFTDLGNARRLVQRYGADFRYCYNNGFHIWDGHRFVLDETGGIMRLAKATVRDLYRQAAEEEQQSVRDALISHARKSESASRLQAMIELAKSEKTVVVTHNQLNAAHSFSIA
jgi:putative DNA primase/helicase